MSMNMNVNLKIIPLTMTASSTLPYLLNVFFKSATVAS